MEKIDLHLHTNLSDGVLSPNELVKLAKNKQCKMISITDHDTICDYSCLEEEYGIKIIPGIEFNTATKNLHLLGYGMTNISPIIQIMSDLKQVNEKVCYEVIRRMQSDGYDITVAKIKHYLDDIGIDYTVIDKRKIVKYLIYMGYAQNVLDAYRTLIGVNQKYYVPNKKVIPEEIIELVKFCNGVAVLAHPNELHLSYDEVYSLVKKLKQSGLMGIEIKNLKANLIDDEQYDGLANRLDLLQTYGSDFHDPQTDDIGVWVNNERYTNLNKKLILNKRLEKI